MSFDGQFKFIALRYGQYFPDDIRNTFVIREELWDDFGSRVRFNLNWVDAEGSVTTVGKLKILQMHEQSGLPSVSNDTLLPERFDNDIGNDYISLGQSRAYYNWLFQAFGVKASVILEALRDIAVQPWLASRFETSTIFRNGMMRENVARRSRRFGRAWAHGEEPIEKASFDYVCQFSNDEPPFRIGIDFEATDILPGRIVGIIGRNAAGKTRFLTQLGVDLTQVRRVSAETIEERRARFPDNKPLFTKIIAVSYSAFDRFIRPSAHDESSYIYCGIRDEKGNLSQTGLQRSYHSNKARVRDLDRSAEWVDHIAKVLGAASDLTDVELRQEILLDNEESEFLARLSSGQAILCHFVTGLLAWIQPESLVLFDEPETHLHPNAVANFFVVLTKILHEHKSYAIAATHSPIVIQEIPSKRVVVFTRENGATYAEPLEFESFGESVAELTEHVFNTQEAESPYRNALDDIVRRMELDDAMELFTNKLGMNAKSYLLARYARKK